MKYKPQIVIIGAGNIAWHLCKVLSENRLKPVYIYSRTHQSAAELGNECKISFGNRISEIPTADIYLLAVSDNALIELTQNNELKQIVSNALCLHTAGSVDMQQLATLSKNIGVLYPLQTFSKKLNLNFKNIPLCLEANSLENLNKIQSIAKTLSPNIQIIDSKKRAVIHLAAVFACNFTNHITAIAEELLQKSGIEPDILHPLIKETTRKITEAGASNSQTGPALRNDTKTLEKHRKLLNKQPKLQKIYNFVTSNITTLNKVKLMDNFKEKLKDIKAFVFDVDGVFSDLMILHTNGDLMRHMNVKDGFAVKTAADAGYIIGIITGGDSESVRSRFERLGVKDIYLQSPNKMRDFEHFLEKNKLKAENILYMGDDIPDYEVMKNCALATCPADAVEEIQSISHYISDRTGGTGCVRDVIEQVMRAQGKWCNINGKQ